VPWADRFHTATADGLIADLPERHACAASRLLEGLDALGLPPPGVRWMGTWKWTIAFEPAPEQRTPPVYLIPNPHPPRVCTRLDARTLEALPANSLQRPARAAMASGVQIGCALWVEWAIESTACADDLITLVRTATQTTHDTNPGSSAKPSERSDRHSH